MLGNSKRTWRLGIGLSLLVILAVGFGTFISWWPRSGSSVTAAAFDQAGSDDSSREPISVTVVRAKADASFNLGVEQPAYVAAYYQADLMARVAGPVKSIVHDKGDSVKAGEVLVTIDVPDIVEDLQQAEAMIQQRAKELDLATANVAMAEAAVQAARGLVAVKQSDVRIAQADADYREKLMKRFKGLVSGPSPAVTPDVYDEQVKYYEASVATVAAAKATVIKAEADLQEAQAKLEAARADVNLKRAIVEVARKNRDKAQALLSFATLQSPFDGVITRRNVDPGSFVQNAASHADPLLSVIRDDIVTVYMKVPDNYAPYVTTDTEAVIQLSNLPGLVIRSKVTRFSPSLENPEHDRTMRVEVDLYNRDLETYRKFVEREKASGNADLKSHELPYFPKVEGKDGTPVALNLLPGTYGRMRLLLKDLQGAKLLPSSSVFNQGGHSYVFMVKDDKAVRVPVEVQVDDGRNVKLSLIKRVNGQEVRVPLTGSEEIVLSNQGELSDGQAVKTTPVSW